MIEWDLEVKVEINPFLLKLLVVTVLAACLLLVVVVVSQLDTNYSHLRRRNFSCLQKIGLQPEGCFLH